MKSAHLFAGIGGGLLADMILGHDPVFALEIDPFCCERLRERQAEGWLPEAMEVINKDVKDFDPLPYAGKVDCLCAGFPCQDISRIGSGAGITGERSSLYREALRCLRLLGCRYAYLENVSAIVMGGIETVTADLSSMGYDARWCCLSSGETGASMLGNRWWCLAEAVRYRLEGQFRERERERESEREQRRGQLSAAVASSYGDGRFRFAPDGIRGRQDGYWYDYDGCLRDPPWREDREGWKVAAKNGAPEPGVYRVADADAWRMVKDRIAALGNAQDPVLAATAFKILEAAKEGKG